MRKNTRTLVSSLKKTLATEIASAEEKGHSPAPMYVAITQLVLAEVLEDGFSAIDSAITELRDTIKERG